MGKWVNAMELVSATGVGTEGRYMRETRTGMNMKEAAARLQEEGRTNRKSLVGFIKQDYSMCSIQLLECQQTCTQ